LNIAHFWRSWMLHWRIFRGELSYEDVLATHKTLFESVYPWAGQDRAQTSPDIAVSKGSFLFAHPNHAKIAVEHALRVGQEKAIMARKPGEVMGYLAYGHPFLEGNGRIIMVLQAELAQRAGVSIDWAATTKVEYLAALTRELNSPGKGHLDTYLMPFLRDAVGSGRLASHLARTQGLDSTNVVLGRFDELTLKVRYEEQEQRRRQP
jgi:cell filamentation protein